MAVVAVRVTALAPALSVPVPDSLMEFAVNETAPLSSEAPEITNWSPAVVPSFTVIGAAVAAPVPVKVNVFVPVPSTTEMEVDGRGGGNRDRTRARRR